jgi:hypothetical protein
MAKEIWLDIKMKDLQAAVQKAPREIAIALRGAAGETANEIMDTRGLRLYPPATAANRPPYPYYERGYGTHYSASGGSKTSERYGTQWNYRTKPYGVVIGNRASYAPFVGGDKQPAHMHLKGWRKLFDVARQKVAQGKIRWIYEKWIARGIKRAGFK